MRGLIDDLRYGVSELLEAPRAGSRSAAWLMAGVLLGLGLARWVDAPLALSPGVRRTAPGEATRVPASRLFDREGEDLLLCLSGHEGCPTAPTPSPCAVPTPRRIQS